ncbi:MAG: winged helix-turn-helix transcriptional regulator [Sedimentisphaerales bacterium]|nr:winged helix-turn-helix transcriptional regulator [Sedimentisphaerales bacterium]
MKDDADKLAGWLKILSVGTRVRIIQLLKEHPLCVNALSRRLHVTQGAVSQHLRILRQADLVIDEKRGYFVHYRLNENMFAVLQEAINPLLNIESKANIERKGNTKCAAVMKNKAAENRKT